MLKHKKLPLLHCYHIFSKTRGVYLAKNHYEHYSPQMVPTDPTGSRTICQFCGVYTVQYQLNFA